MMSESIVEWKPRPRNRVFIKLSGGRFFTVPEAETQPLKIGVTLSDDEVERLSRIDQFVRGRDKALRLLAIRSRTNHEIRKALDALELLPAVRDGILVELKERGLLDDKRFATEYIRNRVELRKLGPHRLKFELKKLGVHESIVEKALAQEVTGQTQRAVAWQLVTSRLRSKNPDEKDIRRLGSLLRRRGIDYEIINDVMYQLLQQVRSKRASDPIEP